MALSVQYELRNAMHDHLQAMDLATLNRMPTGQLVSRANSDSTLVQGLLSFFLIMSGNVLLLLLSLGVMIALSPLLAIVSILVVPALLLVSYRMRQKIFPATSLGRPPTCGRRGSDRGRRRQRCAHRQSVRPGEARTGADRRCRPKTLWLTDETEAER